MRKSKLLGHLSALITVSAWGSSFVATKVLMEDGNLTPVEVYAYRFILAYLILLVFTVRKLFADSLKDELQLVLAGVCSGSMFYILENYALQNTTTGNVSLLSSISPIMTTALMALVFRARVGIGLIIGSIVAFAGVGFVIFSHGEGLQISPLGDLLALSTSVVWSIYAITVKGLVHKYNSFFITRKLFFYGVITALPLLFFQGAPYHLRELVSTGPLIFNMLFLVLICTVIAYVIWNFAMNRLGPVASNNYLYLQPLVTMFVAYFVFEEHITLLGYIGCVLIIGGLLISDKLKIESLRRGRLKQR